MQQVTNIQDLKTAINQNGEMIITIQDNDIIIMKIEEYMKKIKQKDIEKNLLKAEEDIEKGRYRDVKDVFKEWKEQYEI